MIDWKAAFRGFFGLSTGNKEKDAEIDERINNDTVYIDENGMLTTEKPKIEGTGVLKVEKVDENGKILSVSVTTTSSELNNE